MPEMSDGEIARQLVNLYAGAAGFDFYQPGQGFSGICYGVKLLPDETLVCFRGSANLADWAHDLFALPAVFPHESFGPIHAGFSIGLDRVAFNVSTLIDKTKRTVICGHSLGAARARVLTAMLLETYQKDPALLETVLFGEPLSGMQPMADYLAPVRSRSYRNGAGMFHDGVTDVPVRIPLLLNWVRASKLTFVSQAPDVPILEEALDPFTFHHMGLYAAALNR
jgi:hypothetical protein